MNWEHLLACARARCPLPELIVAKRLYPVLQKLDRKYRRSKKGFAAVVIDWGKL